MFTNAFRALDIQSRGRRLYVLHSCIFDTQSIISQTDSSASSKEHQSVVLGQTRKIDSDISPTLPLILHQVKNEKIGLDRFSTSVASEAVWFRKRETCRKSETQFAA